MIDGFGPLAGERLELAPGLNIVFGPNESAKTALHAATYAAICGMRRGPGLRKEDREFRERHQPWDGTPWRVRAIVVLADGRRIELTHDLQDGVDSGAVDLALGRDVADEIMWDGAPDGSRWLGFDRISFLATACVRQAEVAAVVDDAEALQDELQRAAASASRDETAAQAIERLKSFSSEAVGLDRRNSTKPLRRAIERLEAAREAHEDAERRHAEYLRRLASLDDRERERDESMRALRVAEAVVARHEVIERERILERARELSAKHPQEPPPLGADEHLASAVSEALTLWSNVPDEPDLTGPTIEELERDLASTPEMPEGELVPAQVILDAEAELTAAEKAIDELRAAEPLVDVDASHEELSRLADDLAAATSSQEERSDGSEDVPERRLFGGPGVRRALIAASVLVFIGLVLAVTASVVVGVAVAGAALAAAVVVLAFRRRDPGGAGFGAAEEVSEARRADAHAAKARRDAALARLSELQLRADPADLRALAARVASRRDWEQRHGRYVAQRGELVQKLRGELEARGHGDHTVDIHAAVAAYKRACAERQEESQAALRRPVLEQRLAARREAERQAAAREDVFSRLRTVAGRVGLQENEPAFIVERLRAWQRHRSEDRERLEQARQEWSELQLILGDRRLSDLEQDLNTASRAAEEAERRAVPFELDRVDSEVERSRLPQLRERAAEHARAADQARGQLEEMARDLPSVAEAEEELEAAQAELDRVRDLDETLKQTIEFLERAQERVYRSIAPVLRDTVRRWLPRVVVSRNGDTLVERYDDVMVDPETLEVRVRRGSGSWRNASHLSHGTKEQIYLLLRVALAEHLTKTGETAPLLLDQITAQCDLDRRLAMLRLLHELSYDRQVIVFTHDDDALQWARENLEQESGRDRLEVRTPVLVA